MKRIIKLFVFVFALVGIIITFNIVSYAFDECNDVDLNVGKILNHNTHINITGDTIIGYYNHINDKIPTRIYEHKAGEIHRSLEIEHNYVVIVLENKVKNDIRYISLYPYVNNGIGGVEVKNLALNENVLEGSYFDFNGCNKKVKTIRYFKSGEVEPFYVDSIEGKYLGVLKRADTIEFSEIGYEVSYWIVSNVDLYSGIVDLVAGRDVGISYMVKTNNMYIGQIIPAGTLIDYSKTKSIFFHYYASVDTYYNGGSFYYSRYSDRRPDDGMIYVCGEGFSYPMYKVMSVNTNHIHLAAVDSKYEIKEENNKYIDDLIHGDVLNTGMTVTLSSTLPGTVKYYALDGTLLETYEYFDNHFITTNPEGCDYKSWVIANIYGENIELIGLNFIPEAYIIPSKASNNDYSGACVRVWEDDYFYYDLISVAIVDAKVNKDLNRQDIISKNRLNKDIDNDRVMLAKNIDKIDSSFGAIKGVSKGIVVDFNGFSANTICLGTIPSKETLVFTNTRNNKKSYILGATGIIDNNNNKREERTGTVVLNNLNTDSVIYPANHTIYLFNGEYNLTSSKIKDNDLDNSIIYEGETCQLYKFYERYPYWVCSITPKDDSIEYENGDKVVYRGKTYYFYSDINVAKNEAKEEDVITESNTIPTSKPIIGGGTENNENNNSSKYIVIGIVSLVFAFGVGAGSVLFIKKKKH